MASTIRIKRSGTAGAPSTLKLGELAYSHLANNGSNGGDILYIGAGTVDGNGDAPIIPIGGNYYVTQINNATDANTASRIVKRDSSGNFSAGTITAALTGNASTATTLANSRNFSASGDATASAVGFNGSANVDLALTLATTLDGSTNKVPGTFGSTTTVPVITVDAKGRITAETTNSIALGSSNLRISGGTGTDTDVVGTDTLNFAGGTGVTTTVTNNQVSFAIGQAVGTGSNVTFNDVSVTGNLTVNGTTTTVNSTTVTIDDPIFTLGGDTAPAADDNKDRGIEFRWHNGTSAKVGFFGFDDSTGYLTFIPDATNTSEVFSGTQGDIQATNFRGALVGNASTATALATSRNFSASGDASASAVGFTGAANVDLALTLATVNSNVGSFGSGTSVPTFTVNAKGLITAAGSAAIPTATSSVLGLASFNSSDFLVTTGAVTIATVDGVTY